MKIYVFIVRPERSHLSASPSTPLVLSLPFPRLLKKPDYQEIYEPSLRIIEELSNAISRPRYYRDNFSFRLILIHFPARKACPIRAAAIRVAAEAAVARWPETRL